ncbi:MAG: hypothetical protein ACYDHT_09140 [Solirubrobacteraceae bacterium]
MAAPAAGVTPLLSVAPVPTSKAPSPGTPQVKWSTGNGSPGNVTVQSQHLKETVFGFGAEGTSAAPWIAAGQVYVFRLYSIGSGRRLLARLTVGRGQPVSVVALAPTPRTTPAAVNRILQLAPFVWFAMFALLAAFYGRDLLHRG